MLSVSVLIVNYNSGARLANVYAALARQSYRNFDVVVVDNASTDRSIETAVPAGLTLSILRNCKNTGFAGGVMDGISACKGTCVAFLNPDAYPDADWLSAFVNAYEKYGPGAVLGSVQLNADDPHLLDGLGDTYHISGVAWRGGFGKPAARFALDGDREIFAACFAAAMVDRERFLSVGGLDRTFFCYHEDVDFGFRHRLMGGRAILVANAVVHHEGSGVSGRYSEFTVFHGIRNRVRTLFKNMPMPILILSVPVFLAFSVGFLLRSLMLNIGGPYWRGWWAGMANLPSVLRQRRAVMTSRTASLSAIASALNWGPFAPFRRAPHLRPAPPASTHALSDPIQPETLGSSPPTT